MKFHCFITARIPNGPAGQTRFRFSAVLAFVLAAVFTVSAQSLAVIEPIRTPTSDLLTPRLESSLGSEVRLIDRRQSSAVFAALELETPFNLPVSEAMNLGSAVGSNYILLVRADNLRRNSFAKKDYFEASAALFLIESRTGLLIDWKLETADASSAATATEQLLGRMDGLGKSIAKTIDVHRKRVSHVKIESAADNNLPDQDRPPMPYRRIKPAYTDIARLYGVEATVDIEVEIDAEGAVTDTRIVRWAGYGLDESVERTIREMQWRPADRKGVPFTMRVLLRYNFKDIDNPDN